MDGKWIGKGVSRRKRPQLGRVEDIERRMSRQEADSRFITGMSHKSGIVHELDLRVMASKPKMH